MKNGKFIKVKTKYNNIFSINIENEFYNKNEIKIL